MIKQSAYDSLTNKHVRWLDSFVTKKVGLAANFARIAFAILVGVHILYSRIFL